jgi:hypothetical protein
MAWVREQYEPATDPEAAIVLLQRRRGRGVEPIDLRPSPEPPGMRQTIVGTVLASFDESGATFLHLQTGRSRIWVGVPEAKVPVGSTVTIYDAQPGAVEEFGLRRRVDRLLLGRLAPSVPAMEAH